MQLITSGGTTPSTISLMWPTGQAVKSIKYFEDGSVRQVEFYEPVRSGGYQVTFEHPWDGLLCDTFGLSIQATGAVAIDDGCTQCTPT